MSPIDLATVAPLSVSQLPLAIAGWTKTAAGFADRSHRKLAPGSLWGAVPTTIVTSKDCPGFRHVVDQRSWQKRRDSTAEWAGPTYGTIAVKSLTNP
jgi:hypothetical protein